MDEHFSRDSHGSYGGRAPLDYGRAGSGASGLLIAVVVLGLIVVVSFFIGSGSSPGPETAPPASTGEAQPIPAN